MRSTTRRVLSTLLVLLAACAVGEAGGGVTVRDSAGIEIVESNGPQWTGGSEWRVSEAPMLSIGSGLDGEPATQFTSIGGLARFDDGRLTVLDVRSSELRFFDSTGTHLQTVGRKGSGPGEFSSVLLTLHRLPGDSLLVSGAMPARQSLFTKGGDFVREIRPVPVAGSPFPLTASAHFADGTAILTATRVIEERTGIWVDSTPFFVAPPGADSAVAFRRLPYQRFSGNGGSIASVAFGPIGRFAIVGSRFYHGFPERYEVAEYAPDGRLVRLIRRAWTPVAVPAEIRDAHRDTLLARATTPVLRARLEVTQFAETFPAFDRLRPDLAGNLWVRSARTDEAVLAGSGHGRGSAIWSVFDSTGAWLGDVRLPEGLDVNEIGTDYIAGVSYDENDVPLVRVYRLIKP